MRQLPRPQRHGLRIIATLVGVAGGAMKAFARACRSALPARRPRDDSPERVDQGVPILDSEVLQEISDSLGGRPEAVKAIYLKFVTSAAAHLEQLREPPSMANSRTLHTLKGSAAMVGANRIVVVAERLHHAGAGLHDAGRAAALAELERELAEFRRVLETHVP